MMRRISIRLIYEAIFTLRPKPDRDTSEKKITDFCAQCCARAMSYSLLDSLFLVQSCSHLFHVVFYCFLYVPFFSASHFCACAKSLEGFALHQSIFPESLPAMEKEHAVDRSC